MQHKTRTSRHTGASLALLALLALVVIGLFATIWSGLPLPRLPDRVAAAAPANGDMPLPTLAIRSSETKKAVLMQAAFDRIGYSLEAVARGYISVPRVLVANLPPDIDRLDALDGRKTLFLRLMLPVVLFVNEQIGQDRQHLLEIRHAIAGGRQLSDADVQWVLGMADAYDQPDADIDSLLVKVDVIPPSLALAQAIEESGWGTSRIARQGNALFGQFGMAGSGDRDYRVFASLTEAVASYARNLNSHRAYRDLRLMRARMRKREGEIDGWHLAGALTNYSERGGDYVETVRSIMQDNRLEDFDAARLNRMKAATILARADQ
ncbi:MAG TPA: hypothetical protein HPQ04_00110 [Rhodospirillaceae bacterium]|nr:hypothetical protein [Rhodospirillaceae bacterium]